MQAYQIPPTNRNNVPDYQALAHAQAWANAKADARRYHPITATAPAPAWDALHAAWEAHMLKAGAQPTTKHYTAPDYPRVLLGQRSIADAQRQADEASGGLVWLAMNRGR
jgi:hypothetical protein